MNSSQIASHVSHWFYQFELSRSIHDFEVRFAAKYPTFNVALWVIQLILSSLRFRVVIKVTVQLNYAFFTATPRSARRFSISGGFFIMFVISVFFRQVLQGNHVNLQLKRMVRQ
jgi:hypothetical protein